MVAKAEVLLGICFAMADYLGTGQVPHVQEGLADAICYVDTLRALMHEAERHPVPSTSGLALPNPTQITVARVYGVEREPRILQVVRELCSSGVLMAPSAADLASPALGDYLYRYLVGKDERAPERFRLLKLAWDYAVDSFGSRQLLFDMFNASDVHANKAGLAATYDPAPYSALARRLAGIAAGEPGGPVHPVADSPSPPEPRRALDGPPAPGVRDHRPASPYRSAPP
jgi:4-hydroxyphenylacetate 3-monooxygenase